MRGLADQVFKHRFVRFQPEVEDCFRKRVPCGVHILLESVSVFHHLVRFCQGRCKFCLSGLSILCQVDHTGEFYCHLKVRLIAGKHALRLHSVHQLRRCLEHFISGRIFFRHHCFAFCDRFVKQLLHRLYKPAHSAVFHQGFRLVQIKFQDCLADRFHCLVKFPDLLCQSIVCPVNGILG